MSVVRTALRRPYTVLVLVLGIVAAALLALRQMPADVFPPQSLWNDRLPIRSFADYAVDREEPRRGAAYEGEPAMKNVRFIGLDVHAETIAAAVAEPGGEVRSLGTIPNRPESVGRLIRKLGKPEQLRVCCEAGPKGVRAVLAAERARRALRGGGPDLGAGKAGDRVKTDRRDAEKLARCYRAGNLTAVWVPDAAHEALRDLVRARLIRGRAGRRKSPHPVPGRAQAG